MQTQCMELYSLSKDDEEYLLGYSCNWHTIRHLSHKAPTIRVIGWCQGVFINQWEGLIRLTRITLCP